MVGVFVSLGLHNKIPKIGWLEQYKFISSVMEAANLSASMVKFCWCLSFWLIDSCFLTLFSHGRSLSLSLSLSLSHTHTHTHTHKHTHTQTHFLYGHTPIGSLPYSYDLINLNYLLRTVSPDTATLGIRDSTWILRAHNSVHCIWEHGKASDFHKHGP